MSPALPFTHARFHDIVCGLSLPTVIIVAILAVTLCCRDATRSSPTLTIVDIIVVEVLILLSPNCVDRLEEEEYKKEKMLDKKNKHVQTYLSFVRLVCLVCLV